MLTTECRGRHQSARSVCLRYGARIRGGRLPTDGQPRCAQHGGDQPWQRQPLEPEPERAGRRRRRQLYGGTANHRVLAARRQFHAIGRTWARSHRLAETGTAGSHAAESENARAERPARRPVASVRHQNDPPRSSSLQPRGSRRIVKSSALLRARFFRSTRNPVSTVLTSRPRSVVGRLKARRSARWPQC